MSGAMDIEASLKRFNETLVPKKARKYMSDTLKSTRPGA